MNLQCANASATKSRTVILRGPRSSSSEVRSTTAASQTRTPTLRQSGLGCIGGVEPESVRPRARGETLVDVAQVARHLGGNETGRPPHGWRRGRRGYATAMADGYEFLKREHRNVETMFDQYRENADDALRASDRRSPHPAHSSRGSRALSATAQVRRWRRRPRSRGRIRAHHREVPDRASLRGPSGRPCAAHAGHRTQRCRPCTREEEEIFPAMRESGVDADGLARVRSSARRARRRRAAPATSGNGSGEEGLGHPAKLAEHVGATRRVEQLGDAVRARVLGLRPQLVARARSRSRCASAAPTTGRARARGRVRSRA